MIFTHAANFFSIISAAIAFPASREGTVTYAMLNSPVISRTDMSRVRKNRHPAQPSKRMMNTVLAEFEQDKLEDAEKLTDIALRTFSIPLFLLTPHTSIFLILA
mmetsp:Transcript_35779/g.93264  ORF Transcript_35779/g.93264 Transcript_35779/m.93264 type:complete len:104 (+) Transcript_35779:316-627(+)